MIRKRLIALIATAALAAGGLLSFATPASAQRIWPLIGCNSFLDWPCPGPVIVNP